jgi:hypothetical protein
MTIQEYDLVAPTEDHPGIHKTTHKPIHLRRGQMGTVVMTFHSSAYLVDFVDSQGKTYAMETIPGDKLLVLLQEPEVISA